MRANINGFELAYEVSGPEGAPVVLLHHTLATSVAMWRGTVAKLAERYRVVAMDARGHGASETPSAPYDFATLAADITGLLDALGVDKAHYMGSSMGGMAGQCMGFMAPERVESLILISTTSAVPEAARGAWDERIAAVREGGMEPQVATTMERWFTGPFLASGDPVLAETEAMIRATPPEGFIGWGTAIRELNVTDRLGEVSCPTLVVVGEEDPSTPVAASRIIHDAIPGSELVIVERSSHQLPLERPEPFMAAVSAFLEGV